VQNKLEFEQLRETVLVQLSWSQAIPKAFFFISIEVEMHPVPKIGSIKAVSHGLQVPGPKRQFDEPAS
jgi:hypothetical protein